MSEPDSVSMDSREGETTGEETYEPVRTLSELEKKYLDEFFTGAKNSDKRGRKAAYYIIPTLTIGFFIYDTIFIGFSVSFLVFVIVINFSLYYIGEKITKGVQSLGLDNPVIQMEGDFTYRSVSFSIIGSGLHIDGVSVGFPPGWGEAINFHQFTGHEVTAEVYETGNQRLILAIEGETYSGEHKRFTLEEALESELIDIKDARPS